MAFCGFNTRMVAGLTTFVEGLFIALSEKAKDKGVSIEQALKDEVKELGYLLEAMEARYQEIRKGLGGDAADAKEVMRQLATWIIDQDIDRKQPNARG